MRPLRFLIALLLLTSAMADETLPRVLIIGGSVYRQPAAETVKELKNRAEVVYAAVQPGEVCNTTTALAKLDEWLGDGSWDMIHFNFGLADLVYRAPGMKAFRVFPQHAGGIRTTEPDRYEKNLHQLVNRLQATGAKLVWASTTPIRHSSTNVFALGSEIEYNTIAARVMGEHGVPTNDMYAHVLSLIDMTKPASHGADPFHFDKKPIHPPIVENIVRELAIPKSQQVNAE
jgi:hypothetical protein